MSDVCPLCAGRFGFVEMRTEELASSAMALDKVELCGRNINVGRPKGYVEPPHVRAWQHPHHCAVHQRLHPHCPVVSLSGIFTGIGSLCRVSMRSCRSALPVLDIKILRAARFPIYDALILQCFIIVALMPGTPQQLCVADLALRCLVTSMHLHSRERLVGHTTGLWRSECASGDAGPLLCGAQGHAPPAQLASAQLFAAQMGSGPTRVVLLKNMVKAVQVLDDQERQEVTRPAQTLPPQSTYGAAGQKLCVCHTCCTT